MTAAAGTETVRAIRELRLKIRLEARDTRRSIPASTIGVVIVTGVFYLLVVVAEMFGAGRHGVAGLLRQSNPAAATVLFLFPLWGILHPRAYTLVNLLPFAALGWLCLGAVVAGVLSVRRPASFETLGRVTMPAEDD